MTNPLQITVATSGERLDKHLAEALPSYSRAQLQQWIKAGQVRVNDNYLVIRGKRHDEHASKPENFHLMEINYGQFERAG